MSGSDYDSRSAFSENSCLLSSPRFGMDPKFVVGMSQFPWTEVDRLFRGSEIGKDLVAHVLHTPAVWRATAKRSSAEDEYRWQGRRASTLSIRAILA